MNGKEALKYLIENKIKHWLKFDNSNECLMIIADELEILDLLKKFIKSDTNDLFEWCEQYDEVNNTNVSQLIKEWLSNV